MPDSWSLLEVGMPDPMSLLGWVVQGNSGTIPVPGPFQVETSEGRYTRLWGRCTRGWGGIPGSIPRAGGYARGQVQQGVNISDEGGYTNPPTPTILHNHPPALTSCDGHRIGRYASYWNAFLIQYKECTAHHCHPMHQSTERLWVRIRSTLEDC